MATAGQQPDPAGERPDANTVPPAHGDEADLFASFQHKLVRQLTRHLGGDRHLAEEACAFAWLQLLRRQPDRARIGGWLYTVGKHEAYAILRRRRQVDDDADLEQQPRRSAEDPLEQLEHQELLALVECLSAPQRLALGLFARGYSYGQICAATGKTYTWVNRHITEGRARIRDLAARRE
jgi:RNA polymerase sigma factor (sigma-70 family)